MQLHLYNDHLANNLWQQSGNLFFMGRVFQNGVRLELNEISRIIEKSLGNKNKLKKILGGFDGNFALIFKKENELIATVDICRSIPLAFDHNCIYALGATGQLAINQNTLGDLPKLEALQANLSLFKEVKQLQAGEYLLISEGRAECISYFDHFRNEQPISIEKAKDDFAKIIDKMGEQIVDLLNGKKALVPLSGGYDSRFILALLKNKGYNNVLAFTYGQPEGFEAQTAKKVCEQLAVDWRLIEYNRDLFEETDLGEFSNYCKYASAFGSVPQEQEYWALKQLSQDLDSEECVVLPGFCGDVQAGSFIPDKFFESKWYKNKVSPKEYLKEGYSRGVEIEASDETFEDFWAFYSHLEEWILRERESKYIINGVRAYEFFGFDWYLPLWQKDFIKFWQMVPSAYRRDKALYIEVLNEKLFKPQEIDFKSGGFDSRFKSGGVNTYLRYVLPKGLKTGLKKLLIPKNEIEINNLNYFAQSLGKEMGKALDEETLVVNEIVGEYLAYLFKNN
ncbi:MAG: 7-cyano-7-deazaguanine synthase [Bacteroidia bacterium]